jgi:hypothetical protein
MSEPKVSLLETHVRRHDGFSGLDGCCRPASDLAVVSRDGTRNGVGELRRY